VVYIGYTAIAAYPATYMQEPLQSKIYALIQQLELVKHITDSEFWLVTEELCTLLELDDSALNALKTKEVPFQFAWRNFVCTLACEQGSQKLWQIASQSTLKASTLEIANRAEKAYSFPSLMSHNSDDNIVANLSGKQTQPLQSVSQPLPGILPSYFVQVQDFLSATELEQLFDFVIKQENNFLPTTNSDNDPDYRRSMFLPSFEPFSELLVNRVKAAVPQLVNHLKIAPFQIDYVEAQLTAHNDGNYYKVHNDSGSPDTATRELSYVYYFNREPKAFFGGELTIYDSKIENNFYVAADSFQTVQPLNNSIVFFLSRYMHEVLPVSCPSQAFSDSRFTINGWVRKS
jgi:Rps23 Pro-64 3,4-dihydroxylase Tpa1-like proline 4-hydroxylase